MELHCGEQKKLHSYIHIQCFPMHNHHECEICILMMIVVYASNKQNIMHASRIVSLCSCWLSLIVGRVSRVGTEFPRPCIMFSGTPARSHELSSVLIATYTGLTVMSRCLVFDGVKPLYSYCTCTALRHLRGLNIRGAK